MSPLEIDKALALAIGYLPEHVRVVEFKNHRPFVSVARDSGVGIIWHPFSHTDPTVVLPLVERYKVLADPSRIRDGKWYVQGVCNPEYFDTPKAAVAMAIIRGVK